MSAGTGVDEKMEHVPVYLGTVPSIIFCISEIRHIHMMLHVQSSDSAVTMPFLDNVNITSHMTCDLHLSGRECLQSNITGGG